MSWKDGYIGASFRNVSFRVERSVLNGGRRIVRHTLPERDDEIHEDKGRKNRVYQIAAYILGDEYYNAKSDLMDALENGTPGTLIHPYFGELIVKCDSYSVTEEINQGRICRFDITFLWEKDEALTIVGPSAFDKLEQMKAKFLSEALSFFGDIYDLASKPKAYMQDALSVGNIILTTMDSAKNVAGLSSEYQKLKKDLKNQLSEIINDPVELGTGFMDLIDYGTDVTNVNLINLTNDDLASEQYNELTSITQIQDSSISNYPSLESQTEFPSNELKKHVSRVAMASKAGLVGTMTINNSQEANDIRSEINDLLRTVEEDTTITDDFYAATRDLRVAVSNVINERKLTLAEIKQIDLSEFQPGLVLSYNLYNDITRDIEISDLNNAIHPGFIPGGTINVQSE